MNLKLLLPKKISRKKIYSNELLDLNLDTIRYPSGKIVNDYHVLDFKTESVVVIMLNNKKEICFIKSPRYVTQTVELELPSGGIMSDESILEAGAREVLEETGYSLEDIQHVYSFNPANAISSQKSHVIIGSNKDGVGRKDYDHDEVIDIIWLNNHQILNNIKNKQILDGYTLTALLCYNTIIRGKNHL